MQALDHNRLRDFLLDQLPQPHARYRRQRGLRRRGQRRQDESNRNNDQLEPGRGVQCDLFEELADGPILVDPKDRLGEQWRDEKNLYLGVLLCRRQWNRVRDHDFFNRRVDQLGDGVPRQHTVSGKHPNAGRALGAQRVRDAHQRSAGRDQVIDDNGVHAVDVADDPLLTDDVVLWTALVDKCDRQIQYSGDVADALGATDVGRDDHGVRQMQLADVLHPQVLRRQVIDRNIKETLDGVGVQVKRDDAIRPGQRNDVGHELGRDWIPRLGLFLFAGISVIADDGRDAASRGTPQRVENNKKLHVVLSDRLAGRLDEKDIGAADAVRDLDIDLAVGEPRDPHLVQGLV